MWYVGQEIEEGRGEVHMEGSTSPQAMSREWTDVRQRRGKKMYHNAMEGGIQTTDMQRERKRDIFKSGFVSLMATSERRWRVITFTLSDCANDAQAKTRASYSSKSTVTVFVSYNQMHRYADRKPEMTRAYSQRLCLASCRAPLTA